MIYDAFLFFNELDLLDIRLNLLNDVIDKFVIVESTITFSGNKKPLYFEENKNYFSKFTDKIIHIIINDTPEDFFNINFNDNNNINDVFRNKILTHLSQSTNWTRDQKHWGRETYQREYIIMGLIDCKDDDMIIISDVDEIPNPTELKNINVNQSVFEFKQDMFYYNLQTLKEKNWSGPKMASWSILKNNSLNNIRKNLHQLQLNTTVIENGGWHLSFMGGKNRIRDKIEAYGHQEFNNDVVKNNIESSISNSTDLFDRPGHNNFQQININDIYPKGLLDIVKEKYAYLIK